MNRWSPLLLLLLASPAAQPVPASEIAIIVPLESPITQLSEQEVLELFLKQRDSSRSGTTLIPFDSDDAATRDAFYQQLGQMSPLQLKAYWSRMVFAGRARPPALARAAELASLGSREPRLLTYVRDGAPEPGFRVVLRLVVPEPDHAP